MARAGEITQRLWEDAGHVDVLDLTEAEVDELERLNHRYSEVLPTDETLLEIVRRHLDTKPDAFDLV